MDDDHGHGITALQLAQIGEQWCDFAAGILVDAMHAHERIEHQQARRELGDSVLEAFAVGGKIEPHGWCGDDLDVEISEREAGRGADAFEPLSHDVESILGGVEQDASGMRNGEAAQARHAGGDRHGEVES
jgi:hypothetical protein